MNIRMSKYLIFVISGIIWYCIAIGAATIVERKDLLFGRNIWLLQLLSAVVTSTIVGATFHKSIIQFKGIKWFVLPILTLAVSTTIFGFLIWFILHEKNETYRYSIRNFYDLSLVFLFYSLTYFIWLLYPLALLTQYLIRFLLLQKPIKA